MLNKKRKIAFIHDEFPGGGGERVTMDVAEYLSSFNYEVFVFVGKYSIDKGSSNLTILQRLFAENAAN